MYSTKKYTSTNFFKHTFCEFKQVDDFVFPENTNYKSKSESKYFYTDEGVYRKSNHWGRVANCRWKLISNDGYKNQQIVIGFAKWTDFYPITSSEKIFFIEVDFDNKTAKIKPKNKKINHLFTYLEVQKRVKKVSFLLNDDKWTNYFNADALVVKKIILTEFINSDKTLQEIKQSLNSTIL